MTHKVGFLQILTVVIHDAKPDTLYRKADSGSEGY